MVNTIGGAADYYTIELFVFLTISVCFKIYHINPFYQVLFLNSLLPVAGAIMDIATVLEFQRGDGLVPH